MTKVLRPCCQRGHRYIEGSYAWRPDGSRLCLICERERRAKWRQRAREIRSRRWSEPLLERRA